MKAKEAPEKIYMPNELLSEEWQRHIEGEDTEYIRKDALIGWVEMLALKANSKEEETFFMDLKQQLINF